jgi:high-affinity Fe2+/Pb2+ permease
VLVSCGLAVVGAYALYNVDKHAAGTAVAIALPAAVVFSVVLAWLFSRDRNGGTS